MGRIRSPLVRAGLVSVGILISGALFAQAPSSGSGIGTAPFEFDHLTHRDGLVNSSVSAILQDTDGFLWFASQAGLHRYDGYSMDVFRAVPFQENSLSNQLVQTIYHDKGGEERALWIGTYNGLNRLDLTTEDIDRYPADPEVPSALSHNVVTAIQKDVDGTIWVGTLAGLNRLDDEETGVFSRWLPDTNDPLALPHETVRSLFREGASLDGNLRRVLPSPY